MLQFVAPVGRPLKCLLVALACLSLGSQDVFAGDTDFGRPLQTDLANTIAERGLSVIIAVKNGDHAGCLQEFGSFLDDGLSPSETLMDLGSNTKTVTAAAVLTLVQNGTLTLSTRLGELLDAVPDDKAAITVSQILNHRAGFPESVGSDEEKIGKEDYLDRVFATALRSPPGKTYHYSNVGYALLAAIIENASGLPYETYVVEHVLAPADLEPIGYDAAYEESRSAISGRSWLTFFQRTPIHRASWGGRPVGWNLVGNGGAVTTAGNYVTFLEKLFAGKIVDKTLILDGFRGAEDGADTIDYGHGMVRLQETDQTVFTHAGENILFSSDWRYVLESETIIFTAGLGDDALRTMNSVVDSLSASGSTCRQ